MTSPLRAENLVIGATQEVRGVALEPGEAVLDKAKATIGLLGIGDLSLTTQRLIWVGAFEFLPFNPSWFVPGWRVVVPLRTLSAVYVQGSVLRIVDPSGSHYEFGLRRWLIPSRRLARQWAVAVEGAKQALIRSQSDSE